MNAVRSLYYRFLEREGIAIKFFDQCFIRPFCIGGHPQSFFFSTLQPDHVKLPITKKTKIHLYFFILLK